MNYTYFFAVTVNNAVCCNFLIINDCAFYRAFCTLFLLYIIGVVLRKHTLIRLFFISIVKYL